MPWKLKKGALRKMRRAKELDRRELAFRVRISEKSVRNHESGVTRTVREEHVRAYSKALGCEREDLFEYIDHESADEMPDEDAPGLPPTSTLKVLAKRERDAGRSEEIVTVAGVKYKLLGLDLWEQCWTAYALVKREPYVVKGKVFKTDYLPPPACERLAAELGVGARFVILRDVEKKLPFYATVFTVQADHTRRILEASRQEKQVSVVVEMQVHPPSDKWKGFMIYEKKGKSPTPYPFAFVVQEIIDAPQPA